MSRVPNHWKRAAHGSSPFEIPQEALNNLRAFETKPEPREILVLDLPKPEYLHTIELNEPKATIKKTTALGWSTTLF